MTSLPRQLAWDQTHGRCFYCGIPMLPDKAKARTRDWLLPLRRSTMDVDHRHPTQRSGSDTPENHAPCCSGCNSRKGLATVEEFRLRQKLKSGDFNFRFFGDQPGKPRDFICVISPERHRDFVLLNFRKAKEASRGRGRR